MGCCNGFCRNCKDEKFVKEICPRCKNKDNNKDLCNIIIRMDGTPDCCNKDLIDEEKEGK